MKFLRKYRDKRKGILQFGDYLLLYLYIDNPENKYQKLDEVHFWAETLLIIRCGLKIRMHNGHILTPKDCFIEMNDSAIADFQSYYSPLDKIGSSIIYWLEQKKKYFGWK